MCRFDWAPLLVAVRILRHHGVDMCVGGEAAFAYYNALFIEYGEHRGPVFEIIVPGHLSATAAETLRSTGLFEPTCASGLEFDDGWRSRNGFAHLKTTGWTTSPSPVAIVPDARAGIRLDRPETYVDFWPDAFGRSPGLDGLDRKMIMALPWPRLPTLVRSLPWRMGQMDDDNDGGSGDDGASDDASQRESAREQVCAAIVDLVDGTHILSEWAYRHLGVQNPTLCEQVRKIIGGKLQRIAEAKMPNILTRAVVDFEQASVIRSIPGRD